MRSSNNNKISFFLFSFEVLVYSLHATCIHLLCLCLIVLLIELWIIARVHFFAMQLELSEDMCALLGLIWVQHVDLEPFLVGLLK